NWLTEDRDKLFRRDAIRRAAAEWTKERQREDLLVHRDGRLKDAEALLATPGYVVSADSDERAYLNACTAAQQAREAAVQEEQERRIRDAERIAEEQKKAAEAQTNIARRTRIGLALVALVAVVAVWQYFKAVRATHVATARQLAAQSLNYLDHQLDLALLLSLEANRFADTVEGRGALFRALQHSPHLTTFLHSHTGPVQSVAFSPDGKTLASGSNDHTIRLWELASPKPLEPPLRGHTDLVSSVAFSPDGKTLASGSWDKKIILWEVASPKPLELP